METENFKIEKWYRSVTLKMILLGFMGLVLLIPLMMIRQVIKERSQYADEARKEIGNIWAASQTVTGPVLNVPGTKVVSDDGKYATTTMHILPDELTVTGLLKPEKRYRGIYETVVYDSDISMQGSFTLSGYEHMDDYVYQWDQAYISLGVSDNKGFNGEVSLNLGDTVIDAQPGAGQADLFGSGISFPVSIDTKDPGGFTGAFRLTFGLRGSGSIAFAPVGKTTKVNLESAWDAPKFSGTFLPTEREVTEAGFKSMWVVTHLNRSFPQAWTGGGYTPSDESFGVDLIIEADHYTKAERSAKYGILFILITFFVLIITELRSDQRIHIFYYLLVALALILFFSLLTALSEHIGFNPAYLVSSVATIGLLSAFFRSLLQKSGMVLVISGLLALLYVFIFILLALKDYAFLAGNIGLFVLLGVLMMVSSKYKLFAE